MTARGSVAWRADAVPVDGAGAEVATVSGGAWCTDAVECSRAVGGTGAGAMGAGAVTARGSVAWRADAVECSRAVGGAGGFGTAITISKRSSPRSRGGGVRRRRGAIGGSGVGAVGRAAGGVAVERGAVRHNAGSGASTRDGGVAGGSTGVVGGSTVTHAATTAHSRAADARRRRPITAGRLDSLIEEQRLELGFDLDPQVFARCLH